jgi:hypothetical protein
LIERAGATESRARDLFSDIHGRNVAAGAVIRVCRRPILLKAF